SYRQGSGKPVDLVVKGTMSSRNDILVLAWSDSQKRMVDEFAHQLTAAPWQIGRAQWRERPPRRVNVESLSREGGRRLSMKYQWVEVLPPQPPAQQQAITIAFNDNVPSSYQQGSGQAIEFSVSSTLPKSADVLAIAWSDGQKRMVDEFAHQFTAAPW